MIHALHYAVVSPSHLAYIFEALEVQINQSIIFIVVKSSLILFTLRFNYKQASKQASNSGDYEMVILLALVFSCLDARAFCYMEWQLDL